MTFQFLTSRYWSVKQADCISLRLPANVPQGIRKLWSKFLTREIIWITPQISKYSLIRQQPYNPMNSRLVLVLSVSFLFFPPCLGSKGIVGVFERVSLCFAFVNWIPKEHSRHVNIEDIIIWSTFCSYRDRKSQGWDASLGVWEQNHRYVYYFCGY